MSKILNLSTKYFEKTAQANPLSYLQRFFAITKAMKNALATAAKNGSVDKNIDARVNFLYNLAAKTLYTANKQGLAANFVESFKSDFAKYNAELLSYVRNNSGNPYEKNVYNLMEPAAAKLSTVISEFVPQGISAPAAKSGPTVVEEVNVEGTPSADPLAQTESELEAEKTGLPPEGVISVGPYQRSIPAPIGVKPESGEVAKLTVEQTARKFNELLKTAQLDLGHGAKAKPIENGQELAQAIKFTPVNESVLVNVGFLKYLVDTIDGLAGK